METVTLNLGQGELLLDRLIERGIDLARDCDGTLACSSCRVIVCDGAESLSTASEDELDMLERAAQLAKHPGALAVRLGVEPAGCSGLRYHVDPSATVGDGDVVFESCGIRIVVDAASLPHVQGTTINLV